MGKEICAVRVYPRVALVVALIGRDGKPVSYFRPETTPAPMAAAIRRLIAEWS